MKARSVLALLIIMSCYACSRQEVQVPADVIPRDTMVNILADMHLVEAIIQVRNLGRNDTLKAEAYGRYRMVFEKHRVNSEQFIKSLNYYRGEPAYFHDMYGDVLTRLSEEQAKQEKQ